MLSNWSCSAHLNCYDFIVIVILKSRGISSSKIETIIAEINTALNEIEDLYWLLKKICLTPGFFRDFIGNLKPFSTVKTDVETLDRILQLDSLLAARRHCQVITRELERMYLAPPREIFLKATDDPEQVMVIFQ